MKKLLLILLLTSSMMFSQKTELSVEFIGSIQTRMYNFDFKQPLGKKFYFQSWTAHNRSELVNNSYFVSDNFVLYPVNIKLIMGIGYNHTGNLDLKTKIDNVTFKIRYKIL